MHEVICPHCKKAFQIDEAGYADILKQVRDEEFEKQLHERLELAEKDKENAVELAKAKVTSELQKVSAAKDAEIQDLKAKIGAGDVAHKLAVTEARTTVEKERDALANKLEQAEQDKKNAIELATTKVASKLEKEAAAKDAEINELKAKLDAGQVTQKLAVTEAQNTLEKERDALANKLEQAELDKQTASDFAEERLENELRKTVAPKDAEIQELKAQLKGIEVEHKLETTEAVNAIEKERDNIKSDLDKARLDKELCEKALKAQIKDREDEIERIRDMKARLSTKMVGETLEEHCECEFNRIRATAFPSAYFDKDNDARTGSKGDYIFRDSDGSGTEILSIMFDMKNERDETASKKKNEDFLKELDKDRNEKNCEYAVLVSLLEPDSELYNSGIVDVCHRFPKCTSSGRNSLSRSLRCYETPPRIR